MKTAVCLDDFAQLAGLQRKNRVLQLMHQIAALHPSDDTAVFRARRFRILPRKLFEIRTGRMPSRLIDSFLLLAIGLAGFLVFFLWFLTIHSVTKNNWNLAWAWPVHLVAAWWVFRGRSPHWLVVYLTITALAAADVLAAWFWIPQDLSDSLVPLLLLIVLRSGWRSYRCFRYLPGIPGEPRVSR